MERFKLFSVLALILILLSCSKERSGVVDSLIGKTMGTTYSIKFVNSAGIEIDQIHNKIDSILKEVNQQMSTYISTSEISIFNKFQDTAWYNISYDLANVLKTSLGICDFSNGALDITVGPLVNLWGFGPENRPTKIPNKIEITQELKNVGWENLHVRLTPSSVKKSNPDIYCDLSSTAKGFGVDKVAIFLESIDIRNYLVEIGGELRSKGVKKEGNPWKVGISKPDELGGIHEVIELSNMAMATSGDYWNYFEENGVRFSHTINPKTGRPINHKLASVTVIAKTCLEADGIATALDVMGENEGFEFAKQNDLCAYFIHRKDDQFVVNYTESFKELLAQN